MNVDRLPGDHHRKFRRRDQLCRTLPRRGDHTLSDHSKHRIDQLRVRFSVYTQHALDFVAVAIVLSLPLLVGRHRFPHQFPASRMIILGTGTFCGFLPLRVVPHGQQNDCQ